MDKQQHNNNSNIIPPNFKQAELHAKVNRIGIQDNNTSIDQEESLQGNNLKIQAGVRPYSLCVNTITLNKYGTGFPFYFNYLSFAVTFMFLLFLFVGLYPTYLNYQGEICKDLLEDPSQLCHPQEDKADNNRIVKAECYNGVLVTLSLFNRPNLNYEDFEIYCLLASLPGLLLYHWYFKRNQAIIQQKRKYLSGLTIEDYSVEVQDIPSKCTKKQIKKFFEHHGAANGIVTVCKISMAYQINRYVAAKKKRDDLRTLLIKFNHNPKYKTRKCCKLQTKADVEYKLDTLETQIKKFEMDHGQSRRHHVFTGVAFITFNTADQKERVLENWQMSPITSILYKLKLFWKNFNKLSEATEQPIEDTYLSVYDAPNPSEINWENFGTNFRKMVTVRICSSFYLLKCLFVSYFILATTVFLRKNVTEYFYYVSPFTIAITNIWIEKCSLEYTKYEKLRNSTKEAQRVAKKAALLIIPNTIFPLILIFKNQRYECVRDYYAPGGFLYDAYTLLFAVLFLTPLLRVFDITYLWRRYKQKQEMKKGDKSDLTQSEANDLFSYGSFILPLKFANIITVVTVCAFYTKLIPIAPFLGMLSLVFQYYVDKYLLLRRTKKPPQPIEYKIMPEFFTQLLDYTMLFYVTGCILFWYRDAHHDEWPPFYPDFLILLLCIGLLIIRFLGCHLLNPKWCVSRRRFQSYDEILEEETKDYNSENPAKFINGEKSWYKYLLKDENDPDRIRWLNKQMEKSNCNFDTSTFLSLDNLLRNSAHNTPRISPDKEDEEHEEEIKVECFEIEQGPLNLNTQSSRLLTKENLISKYQKFQQWAWGEEKDEYFGWN